MTATAPTALAELEEFAAGANDRDPYPIFARLRAEAPVTAAE